MGVGFAVGAEGRGVEGGCAVELALRTAPGVEVSAMGPGADGTPTLLEIGEFQIIKF